jgi:hypothetical protein
MTDNPVPDNAVPDNPEGPATVDIIEQVLGSIRLDETGAPPEAMERMRHTVLAATARPAGGQDAAVAGTQWAGEPMAVLADARAARAPARRVRRTAVLAGIAAGLAVAVAGTAILVDRGPDAPAHQAAPRHQAAQPDAPAPAAPLPAAKDAASLLRNAAAAADRDGAAPRPDQFIYSERIARHSSEGNRSVPPGRAWLSVDGSKPGVVEGTDKLGHRDRYQIEPNTTPSLNRPTYTYLTTLPTDPAALRAVLRTEVTRVAGTGPGKVPDQNQYLFEMIGQLLETSVLPPRLAAALYQIASRIPGVRLVPDAVDAAGRHGIGVHRSSVQAPGQSDSGQVYGSEWIFDRHTFNLIGLRLESAADIGSIAITRVAIVDTAPRGAKPLVSRIPPGKRSRVVDAGN